MDETLKANEQDDHHFIIDLMNSDQAQICFT